MAAKPPRKAAGAPRSGSTPRSLLVDRALFADAPEIVARNLLGKLLVRKADEVRGLEELAGRVVEVEAYFGEADPAAHAFAGKTARTAVLYGPPGHAYVYFIYGMHYCLNVSCEPEGRPGCVLIRALEPAAGLQAMAERRGLTGQGKPRPAADLTSGPGRLCQAFGITRSRDNGVDLASPKSSLQIRDDGFVAQEVLVTPRIGIRKAAERMARFLLAGNAHVSAGRICYPDRSEEVEGSAISAVGQFEKANPRG